jgi:ribosomal protein S18 acetylase RimI-like enzyme
MLGDVNLFLKFEDEDDASDEGSPSRNPTVIGEVELMIAVKDNQGRGFGRASLLCFLNYIATHEAEILGEFLRESRTGRPTANESQVGRGRAEPKLEYLVVRIGVSNERSLGLFQSLGFRKMKEEPNYFGELEMRRHGLNVEGIRELMAKYGIIGYRETMDIA